MTTFGLDAPRTTRDEAVEHHRDVLAEVYMAGLYHGAALATRAAAE